MSFADTVASSAARVLAYMPFPPRVGYRRTVRRSVRSATLLLTMSLFCPVAEAQPETPGETLFREGREALRRNELDLACSKFRESYQLERALGPLLNHARCEENRGKLVSARELWREAVQKSEAGSEPRKVAEEHARALEAAVPRVTIRLAPGTPADTRVEIDGVQVSLADAPALVDPGPHVIVGRYGAQEDRKPLSAERGGSYQLEIRINAVSGPLPPGGVAPVRQPEGPSAGWIAGWVVGGVGVLSLGGFAATGGIILSQSGDWSDAGCDQPGRDEAACEEIKASPGLFAANGVTLGVGLAALGTGIILLVTHSSGGTASPERAARIQLAPGPGELGSSLAVSF